ncbi:MAG: phytanoyl-CoA dioxygenase family protein [Gammaproteobacteria bacterium]|nr:phytanoyl-CoA dioxygenase family protein [Gammaproteobacteria bacterium]
MTSSQFRAVSEQEIASYQRDGVVVLRELVSSAWLDRIAAAIQRDIEQPGPFYHGYQTADGGRFHGNMRLFESDQDMNSFCRESGLPQVARRFLDSNKVNLLYDQLFVKEAATLNRTRWHNDQPYWPIQGWQVLSIWVALDNTTVDSGALEFVRGSHRWNRWFQPETFGKTEAVAAYERNPDYEPMPDIDMHRCDYDLVSWDLVPGDAYLFHALTVHGAAGNSTTDRRRRGYTVRYTGDDVVYDSRAGTNRHLRSPTLHDGDPLDSDQFPVIIAASSTPRSR